MRPSTPFPDHLYRARASLRRLVILSVLATLLASCTSLTVRVKESDESKPTHFVSATRHSVLWDLFSAGGAPVEVAENCRTGALHTVRYKTNLLYQFASVLTFGAWVPMDVQWACAVLEKPSDEDGENGDLETGDLETGDLEQ